MASGITAATASGYIFTSHLLQKPITTTSLSLPFIRHQNLLHYGFKVPRKTSFAVCFVVEDQPKPISAHLENQQEEEPIDVNKNQILTPRVAERLARKQRERDTYLIAAVMSSLGITSTAVLAVYYRFYWLEVLSCFSLVSNPVLSSDHLSYMSIDSRTCLCVVTGRESVLARNVWYICSFSGCCCKYQFLLSIINWVSFFLFFEAQFEVFFVIFRWGWNFGQDGLIKNFGMLLCGTCMR